MFDLLTSPYVMPLIAALLLFCAIWPLSVARRDASLVDLAWAPGFAIQLAIAIGVVGTATAHAWVLLALVTLWSGRLFVVLAGRRWREGHEDARYTLVRQSWDPGFWWKSLFIVFLLQAVLQWLIVLGPISGAVAPGSPLGMAAFGGAAVALAGLLIESRADLELDRFKRTAQPGQLLETGLRAYMRHPNYAGEIVFWSGVAMICLDAGAFLGLISPVLLIVFLTKVSGAPLLDERLSATRPAYAAYRARVPGFLPRLSRGQDQ